MLVTIRGQTVKSCGQLVVHSQEVTHIVSEFLFTFSSMQDPSSLDKFNLANFHHLKNNLKVVNEGKTAFTPGLVM